MTIASHHPWLSGLFGDAEISDLLAPEAELARMLDVEVAWTRTIAPDIDADRIAAAIRAAPIWPEDLREGTARDGLPVPDLVRRIKDHVPFADHPFVHQGLTSQDVIDTSLTLAVRDILPMLGARTERLIEAIDVLTERDGHRPIMAMTRSQAALPITVADRLASWTRPLRTLSRDRPRVVHRIAVLQWGGPVGTRDAALPSSTGDRFAAALGLRDPGVSWHSDRTRIAEVTEHLSRLTGAIGKIGFDIALLAQTDPKALRLSGAGESSAMPHKQNPILAELLITLAQRNASDLSLMHHALIHEQERSGSAWMLEWLTVPQMLMTTGRSLTAATDLIESVKWLGRMAKRC